MNKPTSKIIQMSVEDFQYDVLCEDGSIWHIHWGKENKIDEEDKPDWLWVNIYQPEPIELIAADDNQDIDLPIKTFKNGDLVQVEHSSLTPGGQIERVWKDALYVGGGEVLYTNGERQVCHQGILIKKAEPFVI